MTTKYTYTSNNELWHFEKVAKLHGYTKTSDCYWVQIFTNESGNEIVLSREEENSTIENAFNETEATEATEATEEEEKRFIDMTTYDYRNVVKNDVLNYIDEEVNLKEWNSLEELEEHLNDELWVADSVTGNASGSYTFSTWEAEENIAHNLDLLGEALEEFGSGADYLITHGAEAADVTIRCYLLPGAISEALEELAEEWEEAHQEEEEEEEENTSKADFYTVVDLDIEFSDVQDVKNKEGQEGERFILCKPLTEEQRKALEVYENVIISECRHKYAPEIKHQTIIITY